MTMEDDDSGQSPMSRIRQRLPTDEIDVRPPAVRDRLSSLSPDRGPSTTAIRGRLNVDTWKQPHRGMIPDVRGRLSGSSNETDDGVWLSTRFDPPSIRTELSRPKLTSRVPRPQIRGRFESPTNVRGFPSTILQREISISDATYREAIPDSVRNRLLGTDVRNRVASADVRSSVSVPDPEEYILEREGIDPETRESRTTKPEYFVGVIPESHDDVLEVLKSDSDFGPSYMTYPKFLTDEDEDFRIEATSIWVYRSWAFAHFQLHVPLFEPPGEDAVYVFYHHEYNWIRHPSIHKESDYLNPEWQRDRVVELFEEAGLEINTCGTFDANDYEIAARYCREGRT